MMTVSSHFHKENPFLATIIEKYRLSKPGSGKQTYHIVLDLKGSGYRYVPGDSIGVFPVNSPLLVDLTLKASGKIGEEIVTDRNGQGCYLLRELLEKKANLGTISRKFLGEIARRQMDAVKKEHLEQLMADGNKEALKAYLATRHVWDLLQEHAPIDFSAQEIVNLLMPLLPRLYSIASAQDVVGDEVHLTISRLSYQSNDQERLGTCTHYLCDLTPLGRPVIPVYIQPHNGFTIPADPSADTIMIGPGTGIAPYRAFMQQRLYEGANGRHWLFFGEWERAFDFFYEEYWQKLVDGGVLRLDTAFSRDQAHKIYVQHRMEEQGAELFAWLQNGAILYVCGDAHRMAKDVEAALHRIVEKHGALSELEARAYIKELRHTRRYLRDVY